MPIISQGSTPSPQRRRTPCAASARAPWSTSSRSDSAPVSCHDADVTFARVAVAKLVGSLAYDTWPRSASPGSRRALPRE